MNWHWLKHFVLHGCFLSLTTEAKPQAVDSIPQLLCSDFKGYRCVSTFECKPSEIDATLADEIFNLNATDGAAFLGIRNSVRAEEASCFDLDVRKEAFTSGVICCNEDNIITSLPEGSGVQLCSQHFANGYACVEKNLCEHGADRRQNGDGVDQIYFCPGLSQVCCKVEERKDAEEAKQNCEEFASLGYECTLRKSCMEINPRNVLRDAANAECLSVRQNSNPEDELICCHKDQIRVDDIVAKPPTCDQFASEGYQCTLAEDCGTAAAVRSSFGKRAVSPESAVCVDPRQGDSSYASLVCCHKENIKPKGATEISTEIKCNVYSRDGFDCTRQNECLDNILGNSGGEGLLSIRQGGFDFSEEGSYRPAEASCPNHEDGSTQVCCLNKKKTEIVTPAKNCQDTPGYACLPLQKCDADILKSEDEEVLDIRNAGEFVNINQQTELCPASDLLFCCKPKKSKPEVKLPKAPQKYQPKCGQHNVNGLEIRVTNPRDGKFATQFGEWPHVCILYKNQNGEGDIFLGGASIIAPGVVITAAHKVVHLPASSIRVRCGEWDVRHTSELKPHQERRIESVSVHPRYSGLKRVENDVALLHLDVELTLDSHVDTICLPDQPNLRSGQYSTQDCVVMGWGRDSFKTGTFQESMKQIHLPIVSNDKCQQSLRDTRLSDTFKLHESFLCAGGEGFADACEGDGGGPLVCRDLRESNKFELVGIVAWGIGCGTPNVPGVYASVTDALCFIHWATRCKHGSKYASFYDYPQCNSWIQEEISALERSADSFALKYLKAAKDMRDKCPQKIANFQERTSF